MWRMNNEEGATAVVVALMTLVLFGFGAIAVDAGQLYQERRELQNGADAAALAAAQDCADPDPLVSSGCLVTPVADNCDLATALLEGRVDEYANLNANDDSSNACVYELDLTNQFITVETETLSGGNSFLTHWFAWALDHDSTTVRARATAAWGQVGGPATMFPLGICAKWFDDHTAAGFGPPAEEVPYGTDVCEFKTSTYDGGYGWLDVADPSTCQVTVTADAWWLGRSGFGAPTAAYGVCVDKLENRMKLAYPDGVDILVPIYDDYCKPNTAPCGSGEHKFHIKGFGAFRIVGFNFGGTKYYPSSYKKCDGHPAVNGCLKGYFTEFVTYDGVIDTTAPDLGVTTVQLIE